MYLLRRYQYVVLSVFAMCGALTDKEKGMENIKEHQMFTLKLFNHIIQPTMFKDLEKIGNDFKIEEHLDQYEETLEVKYFLRMYEAGMLPKNEIFCLHCTNQLNEAIQAFRVLFHAKDFNIFLKTAAWMRMNLNEVMFVYVFTIAILHREDTKILYLSPPFEIYPFYFVHSDVIQKAQMLKMRGGILDNKVRDSYGTRLINKNEFSIDADADYRISMGSERTMSYFTEDVGLNSYYYYFHGDYPFWMGDDIYGNAKNRRGELYYFVHQQLLARYNLERLSNGLCETNAISWFGEIKNGQWPNMRFHNGWEMPVRHSYQNVMIEENAEIIRLIEDYERRIRVAVLNGYTITHSGRRYEIRKSEDIEILGRMVYGNLDKGDRDMNLYLEKLSKILLGNSFHYMADKYKVIPTILDQYETALRDSTFWQLQKRLLDNFVLFKKKLPPYTREELSFPGVKIDNISIEKLVTYFDVFEFDISNAIYMDEDEVENQKEQFVFTVKTNRLKHQPFKIKIDLVSDKTTDVIVRIFIGPAKDCLKRSYNLDERRLNYFEMETFVYNLKIGKNSIERKSDEMNGAGRDLPMSRDIWLRMVGNLDTESLLNFTLKDYHTAFPQRLLLPKGVKGGMTFSIYVIISPIRRIRSMYGANLEELRSKKSCRSSVCIDTMPLGFPFDRPINELTFYTSNMKFSDVMIFHKPIDNEMSIDQSALSKDESIN